MNAEPAELEIRNPKLEIRNKFKKMEISKTENEQGPKSGSSQLSTLSSQLTRRWQEDGGRKI
jgi:hypothetical protein